MKSLSMHLMVISIWFAMMYCQPAEKSVRLDKDQVETEVRSMLKAYHRDMREEGFSAEFKYLDSSDDFFWAPPGYHSALSYDSVKTILEGSADVFRSIDFEWETLQIYPLTQEIANYSGIVSGKMTDMAGNENLVRILESGTLIKRTDGWKLLSGQSVNLPLKTAKQ